jgi:hypothetical protein
MNLSFKVKDDRSFTGVFQTDDYNKGARLEIHDGTASLVVANSHEEDGYDVYVIPEKILKNRWYALKIEVQNHGFVNMSLDGKKYFQVNDQGVAASMSHLVIGRGFDEGRILDGSICNIEVLSGDCSAVMLNLKVINNIHYETYVRFFGNLFVCFFAVIFWRGGLWKGTEIPIRRAIKERQKIWLPVLLLLQAILILHYDAYRTVITGYFLLFILGGALYPLIVPSSVMRQRSTYVIWPVIGMIYLSIIGGYLIGYSVASSYYLIWCFASLVLLLLINVAFNRKKFIISAGILRKDVADIVIYGTVLVTPVVLILIYPVLVTGYMTSVYRVGHDLMQYAKMFEYLVNGGTLSVSKLRAPEFAGMTPGEMNRYADATMSWPLMNYFRWGITFYQVMLGKIAGVRHSYQVAFISIVIPYLLEAGMVYVWLRRVNGFIAVVALSGFMLSAFNVNMLNLWYEGFLGNAYANVLLIWVMMLLAQMMDDEKPGLNIRWQYGALVGFIMAALFLSYGEVLLFIFPVFFLMTIIVEFIVYRKILWSNYLTLAVGGLLGLVIVLPCNYFFDWALLAVRQLLQEGGNGYAQPLWAMPNEILGLSDIYSYLTMDKVGKLMERNPVDFVAGSLLLIVVLFYVIFDLVKDPLRSKVLKFAGMMVIVTSGVLVYLKSPGNNYTYMKMYVLFSPVIVISLVGGVIQWSDNIDKISGARFTRLLVFTSMVIMNGLLYIAQYVRQATVIEKKQMELAEAVKDIDFSSALIIPYNLGNKSIVYTAIMPALWAVPEYWNKKSWGDKPYYRNHYGKKLYLLVEKNAREERVANSDVIFENGYYLVYDTEKRIRDVCLEKKNEVDFDLLK